MCYMLHEGDEKVDKIFLLYNAMMQYFAGDPKRCQHLIKVHSIARQLGIAESLPEHDQFILEAAALVHDCGIKPGEAKFGRNDGKIQEQEGPAAAEQLLRELAFADSDIERICYLVGHHHTYSNIDGADYQILVEADFIVNFYEDNVPLKNIRIAVEKIFATKAGIALAALMYGGNDEA